MPKKKSFVVAYFIPHNEGVEVGVINGRGAEVNLIDLYEVDGELRSFATEDKATKWLSKRLDTYEESQS